MMFSGSTKKLLTNVIRHADTHNRIVEEDDMWQHQRRHRNGTHDRSRSPGFRKRGISRAHMDDVGDHRRDPQEREDNKSTYWQRQLFKAEEDDPARWGHGGFKDLYPDDFDSDRSRSPSKDKDEPSKKKKKHKEKSPILSKKKKKKKEKKAKKHKKEKTKKIKEQKSDSESDEMAEESRQRSRGSGEHEEARNGRNDRKHYSHSLRLSPPNPLHRDESCHENTGESGRTRESRLFKSNSAKDGNMFSRALLAVSSEHKSNPVFKRQRSPKMERRPYRDRQARDRDTNSRRRREYGAHKSDRRSRSRSHSQGRLTKSKSSTSQRVKDSSRKSKDKCNISPDRTFSLKRRYTNSSDSSSDSPSPKRDKKSSSESSASD